MHGFAGTGTLQAAACVPKHPAAAPRFQLAASAVAVPCALDVIDIGNGQPGIGQRRAQGTHLPGGFRLDQVVVIATLQPATAIDAGTTGNGMFPLFQDQGRPALAEQFLDPMPEENGRHAQGRFPYCPAPARKASQARGHAIRRHIRTAGQHYHRDLGNALIDLLMPRAAWLRFADDFTRNTDCSSTAVAMVETISLHPE